MTRQRVQVVAAVIRAPDGRVLLAQRPQHKHQGGLWEFPGGKVEPGETEVVALQRELQEELGLRAETLSPLIRIQHDYPDKSVELSVWQVTHCTIECTLCLDLLIEGAEEDLRELIPQRAPPTQTSARS
mgnify:CR=1 FL=1